MKKYIDAEAAKFKVAVDTAEAGAKNPTDAGFISFLRGFRTLFDANIDEMPAADVKEVRHGHFEHISSGQISKWGDCSVCGVNVEVMNYCSHCGAKMDEKEIDE